MRLGLRNIFRKRVAVDGSEARSLIVFQSETGRQARPAQNQLLETSLSMYKSHRFHCYGSFAYFVLSNEP